MKPLRRIPPIQGAGPRAGLNGFHRGMRLRRRLCPREPYLSGGRRISLLIPGEMMFYGWVEARHATQTLLLCPTCHAATCSCEALR